MVVEGSTFRQMGGALNKKSQRVANQTRAAKRDVKISLPHAPWESKNEEERENEHEQD